ncbi:hypothetical protein F5888DRAFT_1295705 [Russula emetica]|nr:hypothetical protein F5888DRAFT_1295705 [Russula emetica]
MDLPDRHQTNDFPAEAPPPDPFYHSIPHQLYNHALQNAWVPPAPGHDQPEGHREDIPPPVGGVAGPLAGRAQDPHHVDVAYQGIIDYHPQPVANPTYVFPDVGHVQGVPVQGQPSAPVNQEHDLFDYFPQHVAPGPPQAAFPHPFIHRTPTPNQPRPEDLRRLASRYWYHPDAQVGMVNVEAGTTGQYKVVITLATPIRF